MEAPLLSIIIPMYNVETYLRKCIDSILSQDNENIELVLVDDGSPDDCGVIADEYASKWSNVRVFHKENGGLSDARNYGITKSNGKYLWFVDSDDYVEKETIVKLVMELQLNEPDVLVIQSKKVSGEEIVDERKYDIEKGVYNKQEYFLQLKNNPQSCIFCAQYQIAKKELVTDNGIYFRKGIIHEDELWTPQILLAADTIQYSGLNIYYHIMREGSIMNSKNFERSGECYLIIINELSEVFRQNKGVDLTYMWDHLADTYMQIVWKLPGFISDKRFDKKWPYKHAYYKKTKRKALLLSLSPVLYLKMHSLRKGL